MSIKSHQELKDANGPDSWQFVWDMHERLVALETAADDKQAQEKESAGDYNPHPAYALAAEWKDKHDQQRERADGLVKELGSVRVELREKTKLLHNAAADYQSQYKRADDLLREADTLKRLRNGELVDEYRLVHYSQKTLAELRTERDAALRAEQAATSDVAAIAGQRDALSAKVGELHFVIAVLKQQLAARPQYPSHTTEVEGTINGEPCVWTPNPMILALRRDAERWRRLQRGVPGVAMAIVDGTLESRVDAALAAEREAGDGK